MAPLIVVTGTGTEIGKTHVGCALLRAWGVHSRVVGFKPVETGAGSAPKDSERLAASSTFHVKPETQAFAAPLAPYLAARREGTAVNVALVFQQVGRLRHEAEGVLVELAGGLFSPFSEGTLNADLVKQLRPTATLLVAPDRLGVLHDLGAATRAAAQEGVRLDGVLLNAPGVRDASTGSNAQEAGWVTHVPILANLPRASEEYLAELLRDVLAEVLSVRSLVG